MKSIVINASRILCYDIYIQKFTLLISKNSYIPGQNGAPGKCQNMNHCLTDTKFYKTHEWADMSA